MPEFQFRHADYQFKGMNGYCKKLVLDKRWVAQRLFTVNEASNGRRIFLKGLRPVLAIRHIPSNVVCRGQSVPMGQSSACYTKCRTETVASRNSVGMVRAMSVTETRYEHIILDENNVPVIDGTTMKVIELAGAAVVNGWPVDELHEQYPFLTLARFTRRSPITNTTPWASALSSA